MHRNIDDVRMVATMDRHFVDGEINAFPFNKAIDDKAFADFEGFVEDSLKASKHVLESDVSKKAKCP